VVSDFGIFLLIAGGVGLCIKPVRETMVEFVAMWLSILPWIAGAALVFGLFVMWINDGAPGW
jgi:hypothetical protein